MHRGVSMGGGHLGNLRLCLGPWPCKVSGGGLRHDLSCWEREPDDMIDQTQASHSLAVTVDVCRAPKVSRQVTRVHIHATISSHFGSTMLLYIRRSRWTVFLSCIGDSRESR